MTALFINSFGLVLIGLIVWWFWLYRPPAHRTAGTLTPPQAGAYEFTCQMHMYRGKLIAR